MPAEKYNGNAAHGVPYQRARYVQIENILGETPRLWFLEEQVVKIDGSDPFKKDVASIQVNFDPEEVIVLVNPATGEATGGFATHRDIMVLLHSLYISAAMKRDSDAIVEAEEKAARDAGPSIEEQLIAQRQEKIDANKS